MHWGGVYSLQINICFDTHRSKCRSTYPQENHDEKTVFLILTVVLLTAVMIIPVTPVSATENAKTYSTEVAKLVLDLDFEGDTPYGIPAHRGNYSKTKKADRKEVNYG